MKAYSTIVDTSKKARSSNFCLMFHSQVDTRRDLILLCVLGQLAGHTRKRKAEKAWFRGMCLHCSYCSDLANLCICHAKVQKNSWVCTTIFDNVKLSMLEVDLVFVLSGKSSKLRCLSLATPATSTSFGPPGQFLVVASQDSAV